jgi:Leucine-rich repeat (LRR) protein
MFDRIITIRYENVYIQDILPEDYRFAEDRVGIISLINNNLREVPPAIAKMRNLQLLLISQNPICNLPTFIFRLDFLSCLLINDCTISYIPDDIIYLRNLELLCCCRNRIENVSVNVFNLPKLTYIRLDGNQIRGLLLPPNFKADKRQLFLSDNPIPEGNSNFGFFGKASLRVVFGKMVFFTKEEENAAFGSSDTASIVFWVVVIIVVAIIRALLES